MITIQREFPEMCGTMQQMSYAVAGWCYDGGRQQGAGGGEVSGLDLRPYL